MQNWNFLLGRNRLNMLVLSCFIFYLLTIFTLAFNLILILLFTSNSLIFCEKNKQSVAGNASVLSVNFDSGSTNSLKVFHQSEKVNRILVSYCWQKQDAVSVRIEESAFRLQIVFLKTMLLCNFNWFVGHGTEKVFMKVR